MSTPIEDSASAANLYTSSDSSQAGGGKEADSSRSYWSRSLRIVCVILSIWMLVSLGCGILFRELLDACLPNVGGAPFGFWMAQQGSIVSFLLLLFAYRFLMNRLDEEYGFGKKDQS